MEVLDPALIHCPLCCSAAFRLLQKIDFPSMHFTHYLLGYEDKSEIPHDISERTAWTFSRRGTIELTQCVLYDDTDCIVQESVMVNVSVF